MVYKILISSKTLIPFIRLSNYTTEKTLALANMCLVIHFMGNILNILKENIFLECYFCKEFTHNIHTIITKNML